MIKLKDIRSLFFDNRSVRQTILKNTFWVAVSRIVEQILMLILLIYVARILGATEYGKFTFALAFIALFSIAFNFGLDSIIIREFASEKRKEKDFSSLLFLKLLLGILGASLVLIGSFLITDDPSIRRIMWILALYALIINFSKTIFDFFQAREKMEYLAFVRILETLLIVGAGFFVIFNFPSAENLGWSHVFGIVGACILALAILHFKIQPLSFGWNRQIWKGFLAMSWPLAFAAIFAQLYQQIDSIMMGYFGQITENGWYNAAARLARGSLIPMGFISISFFPVMSRTFRQSQERLQGIWNRQQEAMIFLAFPIMMGGTFLAPKIVEFFYGPEYLASILAFQMLVIMAGIMFLYSAFRQILIVANLQKKFFFTVVFGAIVNVILNLILIPKYSLYGAAFSTIVTHLLIFGIFVRFTLKFTAIKPFNPRILTSILGALISAGVMYLAISQPSLSHLHVLYLISIGAAVYLTSVIIFQKLCKPLKKQLSGE